MIYQTKTGEFSRFVVHFTVGGQADGKLFISKEAEADRRI